MLNIFSCASWPSVCLLWRNVYLGVLPIFLTVQLFGLSLKTETKEYVVSQFRGKHKRHTDFFNNNFYLYENGLCYEFSLYNLYFKSVI